jgi:3-dehydroquinate synthase class II
LITKFRIGFKYSWDEIIENYPSSSYTAKITFTNAAATVTITAMANDDGSYRFTVAGDTFETAGDYRAALYIVDGSDNILIKEIDITVLPSVSSAADLRSHNKKVLDAIKAVLENRATTDQLSISIAGVSLSRMSIDQLLQLKNYYEQLYKQEQRTEAMERGEKSPNSIQVKL